MAVGFFIRLAESDLFSLPESPASSRGTEKNKAFTAQDSLHAEGRPGGEGPVPVGSVHNGQIKTDKNQVYRGDPLEGRSRAGAGVMDGLRGKKCRPQADRGHQPDSGRRVRGIWTGELVAPGGSFTVSATDPW